MIGSYLVDTLVLRMDKGSDEFQEPNPTEDEVKEALIFSKFL